MSPQDGPVSIALLLGLTGGIVVSGLLPVGAVAAPSATTTTTTTPVPWQCFDAREDATYAVVERINESERQEYTVDPVVTFENLSDDGQEIIRTALRLDCKVKQSLWDISNQIVIRNGTYYLVSIQTGQRMTTLVTSSETRSTTTKTTTAATTTTSPPTTTTTTTTPGGQPGFTLTLALLAVVSVAGLTMRRR